MQTTAKQGVGGAPELDEQCVDGADLALALRLGPVDDVEHEAHGFAVERRGTCGMSGEGHMRLAMRINASTHGCGQKCRKKCQT